MICTENEGKANADLNNKDYIYKALIIWIRAIKLQNNTETVEHSPLPWSFDNNGSSIRCQLWLLIVRLFQHNGHVPRAGKLCQVHEKNIYNFKH